MQMIPSVLECRGQGKHHLTAGSDGSPRRRCQLFSQYLHLLVYLNIHFITPAFRPPFPPSCSWPGPPGHRTWPGKYFQTCTCACVCLPRAPFSHKYRKQRSIFKIPWAATTTTPGAARGESDYASLPLVKTRVKWMTAVCRREIWSATNHSTLNPEKFVSQASPPDSNNIIRIRDVFSATGREDLPLF